MTLKELGGEHAVACGLLLPRSLDTLHGPQHGIVAHMVQMFGHRCRYSQVYVRPLMRSRQQQYRHLPAKQCKVSLDCPCSTWAPACGCT